VNPRRLIPYAVIFLILTGTYVGLRWQQAQKQTREQQAKQVFSYQEAEITALTLKQGKEEVQLTRQGAVWEMTKPVQAKTDPETVGYLVRTLADLKQERDLGPGEAKTFGLGEAGWSISFTAKGEQHRLEVGEPVPGGKGYYARKDDDPNVLMISTGTREALNQQAASLRDKTLWAFDPAQVKSIKIKIDKTLVDLEKTGGDWRWVGRAGYKVRADRVGELLRQLKQARIAEFPSAAPKDLRAAGLAPQAKTQVTLVTPQGAESLFLGGGTAEVYARLGPQGQVVKVGKGLPEQIARAATTLEDRRLWSGAIMEVGTVVWGASGKNWTAVRTPDSWKITGPDKVEVKQDSQRLQMALVNFQNLEYAKLLPQAAPPGKEAFTLEFYDLAGKPLFNLAELAKKGDSVEVLAKSGNTAMAAAVPQNNFTRWQQELTRLTTPPPNPVK
jgi:hypothetical protein